jgi:hypothetical protein
MLQNLIECIKLIISNVSVLLIYLINKPIKLFDIKDIQFEYTYEDKKELNELDCYCGACMAPILIGSFFTRPLKYSTDLTD